MKKNQKAVRTQAFTLIELAIVLVIIGLIVASVVVGQSVVRQARLKTLVTQADSLKAAFNTFLLQYGNYPGDIPNAYSYWGANCDGTASNCNGDGNRVIDWGNDTDNETVRANQHLALAGLIPGSYTGTSAASYPGRNCMKTPMQSDSCFYMAGHADIYLSYPQVMQAGAVLSSNTTWAGDSLLRAAEAYSVDQKIDDGLPSRGTFFTERGTSAAGISGRCVNGDHDAVASTVDWVLTDTLISCRVFFLLAK